MKKILPKAIAFIFVLTLTAGAVFAVNIVPQLWERYTLKTPPPFKKPVAVTDATGAGQLKYDHTIVLVGDSMTQILGNSDELRGYLNQYYPDKTFEVLNYGYGATNITEAKPRFFEDTVYGGRSFKPILGSNFDYIIVESFGHNPLSDYPLPEGLKKQTEALDDIVNLVATTSGKQKLIFLATIGTNKDTYVKTSRELDHTTRVKWAKERDAYIRNHIEYAKSHGIPVIDAFNPSMDIFGNAKQYLVRTDDFIHPSPKGVLFISKKIADFLAQNNFFK